VPRWTVVVAAAVLAVTAAPAAASTIVYQCGAGVCAIDPDAGTAPRQLVAQGRVAGITRDGATASWVDGAGNLVQAPTTGGTPRVVYTGAVGNQPSMSPDGSQYLWWQVGPSVWGGLGDVYVYRFTVGQDARSISQCVLCTTTHGWLGATAIAAFPADENSPSEICRIDSTPGSSCVQLLVSDARGGIGFPTGSPDGTQIAAVLTPGETTGIRGRIVVYPAAGGAGRDVTSGTSDGTPAWSADGTRLAFERDGQIVVHDLASGSERAVAPGIVPFWGGTATPPDAALTAPRSHRTSAWRTLRGTAQAASAVEVAVSRRAGKRCAVYTGRRFKTARCAAVPWIKTTVSGGRWSLRLTGLKAGRYTLRVRAVDAQGRAGKAVSRSVTLR
jgi:hypothetical protein